MTNGSERTIFDYDRWSGQLSELAPLYRGADPFPHVVLDDFLAGPAADAVLDEFPRVGDGEWIHYQHVNESKFGKRDRASFGPSVGAAVDELNSPRFVAFLEQLTGIGGLIADPTLEGGGLHQSERGGFLNLHADFTVHPHRRSFRRRVNVLVYLNKDWPDAWGGQLELWDRSITRCVRRVSPIHNRVVIFNTDADSFHGHPDALRCPEGHTRKSLALYYFTEEGTGAFARSTEYRPRPGDGARALLIYADKMALRAYDKVKRRFGLDDRLVSRLLGLVSRRRGKSG